MRFQAKAWVFLAIVFFISAIGTPASAQCGGVERWPVKVGTDPDARKVDLSNPVSVALPDLIRLPALPLVARGDDTTRRPEEMKVYTVTCHLLKFKLEGGKGDQDYHCVLTDDSLLFTDDAHGVPPGHSIVGEIVNPACITGSKGTGPVTSLWQDKLEAVRANIDARFPNVPASGAWVDAGGVLVKITGVAFFDRTHKQTGRTGDGATTFEIHPILNIEFMDGSQPSPTGSVTAAISNPSSDLTVENESAVSFTGVANSARGGTALSYAWDFGDGGSATGVAANHTFSNHGNTPNTYTVTLLAADGQGSTGKARRGITVNPSPATATTLYSHEPNDSMDTAQAIPDGITQLAGYFTNSSDDDDYFSMELPSGEKLIVEMSGPTDAGQDYDLYLFSAGGTQLAKSNGDGTSEYLSFKNTNTTKARTLFIRVTRYKGFSSTIPYVLAIQRQH